MELAQAQSSGSGTQTGSPATVRKNEGDTAGAQPDRKNVPVTEVEVRAAKEGSAEVGYRVETVATTGPWEDKKIQDTPYSISVMPSELIENIGASVPDQVLKVNPLIQVNYTQTRGGNVPISIRGFRFMTSTLEDGMRNSAGYGVFLEDKDRVEVLTGLSGFLYGPANVGGVVNYVSKRPTMERINNITVGNYGGGSFYTHGDFGGKVDKNGKLSYRLNVLLQDGKTDVEFQNMTRRLVSAAVDWRVTKDILLQGTGSLGHSRVEGLPAYWARAAGVKTPAAPDPEKLWTQKWTFSQVDSGKFGINGKWDINSVFALRAAYSYIENEREWHSVNSSIKANGTYTEVAKIQAPFKVIDNGGYGYLDATFKTGPVAHKVTAGFYGNANEYKYHQDRSVDINLTGNFTLADPVYVAEPAYSVGHKPWYTGSRSTNRSWIIGDDIKFNDQWSALVGLNNTTIVQQSYNADGTRTANSHYDKSENTPSAALMYKPLPWLSTYASYMESLEQGTIVPTTGATSYTNAGQILEPLVSNQYEVGAKATLGGMALSTAFFYIDKPNEYDRTNPDSTHTYVQDGREVHKGVEFTAAGRAFDGLTLFGGFTFLKAEVTRASSSQLEGKTPMDVSEQMAKLYAEYDLPYLKGFTLTGGIYYTGAFYGDTSNNDKLPSVVTGDLGARYTTKLFDKALILRLNVTNITNESYWISNYYTGDPRAVTFSAQMKF
jgi:iron complex outermembrane receptor protein